jgi:FkbM family methyltransferase
MISYAQNWEDVWLHRAFSHQAHGFYVDVGANDPVADSVTKHFYDRGWHGINIEPHKTLCAKLRQARPRDVNLQIGLSNKAGSLKFYVVPSQLGWSSFAPVLGQHFRQMNLEVIEETVTVSTLAETLDKHAKQPIDFLKIDVEGHEREVVEGGDWQRWRPRIILIESTYAVDWEHQLLAANYRFALFDGLNRYYVRGEEPQLLSAFEVPLNVLDDFISYRHQTIMDGQARTILDLQNRLRHRPNVLALIRSAPERLRRGTAKLLRAFRGKRPAA